MYTSCNKEEAGRIQSDPVLSRLERGSNLYSAMHLSPSSMEYRRNSLGRHGIQTIYRGEHNPWVKGSVPVLF